MAINPNTIKALFSKLGGAAKKALPLADDAAAAVANYGDDAVRAALPYVDDVADDTTRLLNYMNQQSQWGGFPQFGKFQTNPALNNALTATKHYIDDIPVVSTADGGVLKKAADYALEGLPVGDKRSELVQALSDAVDAAPQMPSTALRTTDSLVGLPGNVNIPKLHTKELVKMPVYGYRPHKNTALGRWFQQNAPQFDLWDLVDE